MRALLLRQKVPPDANRITFPSFEEIDDMWMLLFYRACKRLGFSSVEVWNWGGTRYVEYDAEDSVRFIERWLPNYWPDGASIFSPDDVQLVFARGGFREYIPILNYFKNAVKIYYGAGKRHNPKMLDDPTDYNAVLCDTKEQEKELTSAGYTAFTFIKPACDTIFHPWKAEKYYDVVFIANAPQRQLKGHDFLFDVLKGTHLHLLVIGIADASVISCATLRGVNSTFTGWVPRKVIPQLACRAKIGVCCSTSYESCPRVIPEYLAMDIPILVRSSVRFNTDLYVTPETGMSADDHTFLKTLEYMVHNYTKFTPRKYYEEHLSLEVASVYFSGLLRPFIRGL